MKKLLLIDGNSVLFRTYYSTIYTNPMSTSSGIPTNAVYGFISLINKAISMVRPDAMMVAWDAGKKTFRHDKMAEYKGTRKSLDEELIVQFPIVREYLDTANICRYEQEGYEADDIIGSMAKSNPDYQTTILTSDKDLLQLVDPTTQVILMKKGLASFDTMDEAAIQEKYGLSPKQIIDLKGLMGDPSDNIPGVAHIGEKTALKLLYDYGSVEGVYDHIDELKGKRKEYLEEGKEMAFLSKDLATIFTQMDLPIQVEDLSLSEIPSELADFYRKYEMKSLVERFNQEAATRKKLIHADMDDNRNEEISEELEKNDANTIQYVDHFTGQANSQLVLLPLASLDPFLEQELYGFLYVQDNQAFYLPLEKAKEDQAFIDLLTNDHTLVTWSIKETLHLLDRHGLPLANFANDLQLEVFLLHSQATKIEDQIAALDIELPSSLHELTLKKQGGFTVERALPIYGKWVLGLQGKEEQLRQQMQEQNVLDLYEKIELPLTRLLYEMECCGIQINEQKLLEIGQEYQHRIEEIEQKIYEYAGHSFNVGSPKQLGVVLFDELGLKAGKKRSTSVEVLEKLQGQHPIIDEIMEYRKYSKIIGTYVTGLQRYIHEGKIFTTFNQTVTTTGRLSSSDPNLQNISVKSAEGKEIRKAFQAPEGYSFISADYSQIELRMLAHMADEQVMIEAFQNDVDIHKQTASAIFNVPPIEVDEDQRRIAKTVNFAVIYGQTEFGLSQELGISRYEAKEFINSYFENYPNIHHYMDGLIEFCKEHGYVETMMHRRREIPEIRDKNFMTREFGKRAAMNAPIQGSAADLIKAAMLKVNKAMKEKQLKSQMILQIHDELIFLVPDDELEQMKQLVIDEMESTMELKVPLKASLGVGSDWYEAK